MLQSVSKNEIGNKIMMEIRFRSMQIFFLNWSGTLDNNYGIHLSQKIVSKQFLRGRRNNYIHLISYTIHQPGYFQYARDTFKQKSLSVLQLVQLEIEKLLLSIRDILLFSYHQT